jgi:hypothetical protein
MTGAMPYLPGHLISQAWVLWHDGKEDTMQIAHRLRVWNVTEAAVYNTLSRMRGHYLSTATTAKRGAP